MENDLGINESEYQYLPDFELQYKDSDLESLTKELSDEEEKTFKEILELEKQRDIKSDLMKDLLDAAKKGTMQYIDSMTDTGETFDRLKDPNAVRDLNDESIIKLNPSANPDEKRDTRTMNEARYEVFDKNVPGSTTGMSSEGAKLFMRHKEAYTQRTKSVTGITNENHSVHYKQDAKANFESLSGLRGYRVGPVVPMYSVEDIQEMYNQQKSLNESFDNPSNWLMQKNYAKFEDVLMKDYGFSSRSAALNWMRENHLTVHEGPDGMFLVPTDVHDAAKHSGYRSKMTEYLKGRITKDELNSYVTKEKIEYAKHEARIRGTRAIKGIGLSVIKDIIKCAIVVLCEETYKEFKQTSEAKFVDRMLCIFKRCWEHIKVKFKQVISNLWKNIKGSLLSEMLTALNDFLFGTFKNIFRVVRQMWGSIKSAFKIIFSKDNGVSLEERMFEASKILSAGIVSLIGFSLNEIIEKGLMSIGIPFASFIAECLSGLFAGIMSAIVIMLFDKFKKKFLTKSVAVRQLQLESRSLCVASAKVQISSLQVDIKVYETYQFIGQMFLQIGSTDKRINDNKQASGHKSQMLKDKVTIQSERNNALSAMNEKYKNDIDF